MTEAELLRLIEGGENIQVEFKRSTTEITKDVYDTVCSFSNRKPTRWMAAHCWSFRCRLAIRYAVTTGVFSTEATKQI